MRIHSSASFFGAHVSKHSENCFIRPVQDNGGIVGIDTSAVYIDGKSVMLGNKIEKE